MKTPVTSPTLAIAFRRTYQNADDAHDQKATLDIEALLAHELANSFRDTDGALANDDNSQKTHALHEMRLLEAEHTPSARDRDDADSLEECNGVPHEVHKAVVLGFALESRCHGAEGTHANEVDDDHEAEREV